MAALRKVEPEDRRPRLSVVPRTIPMESLDGSPARGILIGVVVSVAAFWLPAAVLILNR